MNLPERLKRFLPTPNLFWSGLLLFLGLFVQRVLKCCIIVKFTKFTLLYTMQDYEDTHMLHYKNITCGKWGVGCMNIYLFDL